MHTNYGFCTIQVIEFNILCIGYFFNRTYWALSKYPCDTPEACGDVSIWMGEACRERPAEEEKAEVLCSGADALRVTAV